jgi:16S rRNA (adenine1518-N6/adenine1519-N6)-dimethyltransferase
MREGMAEPTPDDDTTHRLVDLLLDRRRADKELGQHYLLDPKVLDRAVELASLSDTSHVLEVGPGPGTLTLRLVAAGARVTAIEIDEVACEHLRRTRGEELDSGRLSLVEGDALQVGWPDDITHVVSNPPFQISSPLLAKVDRWQSSARNRGDAPLKAVVLLLQEEFAQRMAMEEGPASRGPLGMQTAFHWHCELDALVPPHAFAPHPAIHSRLLRLTPRNLAADLGVEVDMRLVKRMVDEAFLERRKKVKNRLKRPPKRIERVPGWHRARWRDAVTDLLGKSEVGGVRSDWREVRPDELEPVEWLRIGSELERVNHS